MFFVPAMLFAAIGDNGISVAPDGTQLKWEEGAWDFFIMHKSLIEKVTGEASTTAGNPQADTCIDPNVGSTYRLTSKHIPPDADVSRAFLVWLAPQNPDNLSGTTDHSVTLTFKNAADPEITLMKEVTASFQGNLATTTIGNFEYEALNMQDSQSGNTGVYTYRVEVSDFMKEIIKMGEAKKMDPGEALYGDYTVTGMDCNNHQNYLNTSGLVGGWFLPFVYTSANINAKKIYFYNGLAAYHIQTNQITVSGFELPDEAVIKLGLVVFEGDPGLANTLYPNNPEGLKVSSQNDPANFAPLFNDCNPPKTQGDVLGQLNYTEMFNSISSVFSWENNNDYWCIGNPNNPEDTSNPLEYAIDADILMVDASKTGPFYGIFQKGDTSLNLQIGANQDQVYTNILVVSVDTKLPAFDIPNEREKEYCSCSTDEDAVCSDRPFYYTIKVQNHGQNVARDVKLEDVLPTQVDYVPGTTEIARKFNDAGLGTDWEPVPDVNGGFPYATAQLVADKLEHCDNGICGEDTTAWIRFVVRPKANLSKNEVLKNSADIISEGGVVYHSNSSIPLRLKLGKCPAVTECELPSKMQCGGVKVEGNDNYCSSDKDCKDGKKCINNECILDSNADLAGNIEVSYDLGTNSPDSGTASIIIPSPSNDLVLGQFYLLSDGDKGKSYELHTLELKLNKDSDVSAKNFKLYKDNDGNGKVNEGDTMIATADSLKNSVYIDFAVTEPANRLVETNIKTHFLVTADVKLNEGGRSSKFSAQIENSGAFSIKDANGAAKVKGSKVDFASYRFEPENGFIFTKGEQDPKVPSFKQFNGEHEVLQVRTKSKGSPDAISSIKVKTAGSTYAKFGEGIKSISVIIDNDKNGVESAGDTLVKKVTEFTGTTTVTIDGLKDMLTYGQDEEKYLLFKVEFKLSVGEKAKFQIPGNGVKITSGDKEIVELPVTTKEFSYECDKSDPTSCGSDDEGSGCAVSALPEENNSTIYVVLAAIASMLALAAAKLFTSKK